MLAITPRLLSPRTSPTRSNDGTAEKLDIYTTKYSCTDSGRKRHCSLRAIDISFVGVLSDWRYTNMIKTGAKSVSDNLAS